jgi:hypothetical protein
VTEFSKLQNTLTAGAHVCVCDAVSIPLRNSQNLYFTSASLPFVQVLNNKSRTLDSRLTYSSCLSKYFVITLRTGGLSLIIQ